MGIDLIGGERKKGPLIRLEDFGLPTSFLYKILCFGGLVFINNVWGSVWGFGLGVGYLWGLGVSQGGFTRGFHKGGSHGPNVTSC